MTTSSLTLPEVRERLGVLLDPRIAAVLAERGVGNLLPHLVLLIERAEAAESALERLHARIHRDLPGDGSEVPQPDDLYWARTLDDLVSFADEVYREIETETAR